MTPVGWFWVGVAVGLVFGVGFGMAYGYFVRDNS